MCFLGGFATNPQAAPAPAAFLAVCPATWLRQLLAALARETASLGVTFVDDRWREEVASMSSARALIVVSFGLVIGPACGGTPNSAGPRSGDDGGDATSSARGAGNGAGSSSGATTTSGSGSASSGGSGSSSGSTAGSCASCAVHSDCQNTCGAPPSGHAWCCSTSVGCYDFPGTACPVLSDGGTAGTGGGGGAGTSCTGTPSCSNAMKCCFGTSGASRCQPSCSGGIEACQKNSDCSAGAMCLIALFCVPGGGGGGGLPSLDAGGVGLPSFDAGGGG